MIVNGPAYSREPTARYPESSSVEKKFFDVLTDYQKRFPVSRKIKPEHRHTFGVIPLSRFRAVASAAD